MRGNQISFHRERHLGLTYLIDDLIKASDKLTNTGELEYYDKELLTQILQKLEDLRPMHIGTTEVLDSIQYLLGEMQTGRYDRDEIYLQIERMIDSIQDYLDFR